MSVRSDDFPGTAGLLGFHSHESIFQHQIVTRMAGHLAIQKQLVRIYLTWVETIKLNFYECRSHSLIRSHEWIRLYKTVAEVVLERRSIENDTTYEGDLTVQQKRWSRPVVHVFILSIIDDFKVTHSNVT